MDKAMMLIMMLEKPMFDLLMLTAMMNTFLMFIAKAIEKMMSFFTRRLVLFSTWMSPISAKVEGDNFYVYYTCAP